MKEVLHNEINFAIKLKFKYNYLGHIITKKVKRN